MHTAIIQMGTVTKRMVQRMKKNSDYNYNETQSKSLKQLEQFDKEFKKIYDGDMFMMKFSSMCFMGIFYIFYIALYEFDTDYLLMLMMWTGLNAEMIDLYLDAYLIVKDNGENVKIWDLIKWLPIDRHEFRSSRIKYLNKLVLKLLVIALIITHLSAVIAGKYNISCLLAPMLESAVIWLAGYWHIKSLT